MDEIEFRQILDDHNHPAIELTKDHMFALRKAMMGSCTCMTKTPNIEYHDPECQYRLLTEVYQATRRPLDKIKGGDVKFWHHMYEQMCQTHDAGFKQAYKYLGIEDDGEYRWKWLLLELASLEKVNDRDSL